MWSEEQWSPSASALQLQTVAEEERTGITRLSGPEVQFLEDVPRIEGHGVVQAVAQAEVGGVIVMVRFIAVALERLKRC